MAIRRSLRKLGRKLLSSLGPPPGRFPRFPWYSPDFEFHFHDPGTFGVVAHCLELRGAPRPEFLFSSYMQLTHCVVGGDAPTAELHRPRHFKTPTRLLAASHSAKEDVDTLYEVHVEDGAIRLEVQWTGPGRVMGAWGDGLLVELELPNGCAFEFDYGVRKVRLPMTLPDFQWYDISADFTVVSSRKEQRSLLFPLERCGIEPIEVPHELTAACRAGDGSAVAAARSGEVIRIDASGQQQVIPGPSGDSLVSIAAHGSQIAVRDKEDRIFLGETGVDGSIAWTLVCVRAPGYSTDWGMVAFVGGELWIMDFLLAQCSRPVARVTSS